MVITFFPLITLNELYFLWRLQHFTFHTPFVRKLTEDVVHQNERVNNKQTEQQEHSEAKTLIKRWREGIPRTVGGSPRMTAVYRPREHPSLLLGQRIPGKMYPGKETEPTDDLTGITVWKPYWGMFLRAVGRHEKV